MAGLGDGEEWFADAWATERYSLYASNSSDIEESEIESNVSSVFTTETDDVVEMLRDDQVEAEAKTVAKFALSEVAERTIHNSRNSLAIALVYELFEVYSRLIANKRVTVNRIASVADVFLAWKILLNPTTLTWQRHETEKKLFQDNDDF